MTVVEPDRQPASHPPYLAQEVVRRLAMLRQREWAGVRITDVAILADLPGTPERHQRVRAHVRLGQLTPADVRVQLTSATLTADTAPGDPWMHRLTCSQAYANGHFVFEAHVPEHQLDVRASRLTVVVEPLSQDGDVAPSLEPVKRRLV